MAAVLFHRLGSIDYYEVEIIYRMPVMKEARQSTALVHSGW
ncbi:MAG: hypothetical protein ACLQPD_05205 [Desulfomonilaceae bacterium]